MPSMVVMARPTAAPTGITQDRIGMPFTCTVQAPQSAAPQPNLVPVNPSSSRKAHSRGMSDGTSSVCDFPLILKVIIGYASGTSAYTSGALVLIAVFSQIAESRREPPVVLLGIDVRQDLDLDLDGFAFVPPDPLAGANVPRQPLELGKQGPPEENGVRGNPPMDGDDEVAPRPEGRGDHTDALRRDSRLISERDEIGR